MRDWVERLRRVEKLEAVYDLGVRGCGDRGCRGREWGVDSHEVGMCAS